MRYVSDSYGKKYEMTRKTEVKCDKCEEIFSAYVKELYFNNRTGLIVEGYTCPKCGEEYITLVSDNKLRKILVQVADAKRAYEDYHRALTHEINAYKGLENAPKIIRDRAINTGNRLLKEYQDLKKISQSEGIKLRKYYIKERNKR